MKLRVYLLLLFVFTIATAQSEGFLPLGSGNSLVYKSGTTTFAQYFSPSSKLLFGKNYFLVITLSDDGDRDTSYFRESAEGTFSLDNSTGLETMVIPGTLIENTSWLSGDSSWQSALVSANASINTPADTYKNLLEIETKQLTRSDENKADTYILFFGAGKGLVATKTGDTLQNYLNEVQSGVYVFPEKKKQNRNNVPALIVLFTTIATFVGVGVFLKHSFSAKKPKP